MFNVQRSTAGKQLRLVPNVENAREKCRTRLNPPQGCLTKDASLSHIIGQQNDSLTVNHMGTVNLTFRGMGCLILI